VKFTPAGSTHPYKSDAADSDIRIAPSFATVEEIEKAVQVLALCTKAVCLEKILSESEYAIA
jgi:DNA-binding transcriptional MocR family regulator